MNSTCLAYEEYCSLSVTRVWTRVWASIFHIWFSLYRRPAFYVYFVIKFMCAAVILRLDLEFKKPSETVVKDFKAIITTPEISMFLLMTFLAGNLVLYILIDATLRTKQEPLSFYYFITNYCFCSNMLKVLSTLYEVSFDAVSVHVVNLYR